MTTSLLALGLLLPSAFAQAPLPRRAIKDSATRILNQAFPGQMSADEISAAFNDPNAHDEDGSTALMRAAQSGDTERVKALLAIPGIAVDERDPMDRTALMIAAIHGRTEAARLLLDAKADPKAVDNSGETALLIAASMGYSKTVKLLLDGGSDVNQANAKGETPLFASLMGARAETVSLLARAKGAKLDAKTKNGTTALVEASRLSYNSEMIGALIDAGADKNLPADYVDYDGKVVAGYTPLMTAAFNANVPGVKTLLGRGVNFDYRDPASGKTALGVAKLAPVNQEVINLLTAWGAHE